MLHNSAPLTKHNFRRMRNVQYKHDRFSNDAEWLLSTEVWKDTYKDWLEQYIWHA